MLKIHIIYCQTKRAPKTYPFASSIVFKNTTTGNISVFKDLNIRQLGLKMEDTCWQKLLTIWWDNLKTEVQMLSIKA